MNRPHILLIHSDQHRYDCVRANGHPYIHTPNLDRLAAGGVNFSHAFTPNPVCSPARACLQTGTWSSIHKCVTIPGTEAFQTTPDDMPKLTQLLADADYRVAHVGKFHAEVSGGPTDHGAEKYIGTGEYRKWREAEMGLPPRQEKKSWWGTVDRHATADQTCLGWQCARSLEILNDFASTASERPFFFRWDPPEPHLPNLPTQEFVDLYPLEKIEPWPGFPDPLRNKSEAQRRTRLRWKTDDKGWDFWAPVVQKYLADISLLDAQVGKILDWLDETGLAENTLVIYSTDHGDMCGGHGMMDKHYNMYEDIMRVPLMARWPGHLPEQAVCDRFISHELDMAKTILHAAGIEAPQTFLGRSLISEAAHQGEARPDIFAQYMGTHQGMYSMRMLRDKRFKYVYSPSGVDELYDLENDPGELRNLICEAETISERDRLMNQMTEVMKEIRDPLSGPTYTWE